MVLQVTESSWPRLARSQGSLVADEVAVIGAKVPGRVEEVHVDLGSPVTEGAELMSLDREDLKLEIAQAEAQFLQARAAVGLPVEATVESLQPQNSPPVREAQAVLDEAIQKRERLERLRTQGAVTETEMQQVQAAEKVAIAQLASATNSVNEKIAMIRVRAAELAVAKQRFADAAIPAPFNGYVLERHVAPGSYVQAGQAVVTLVRTNPLRFQGTLPERFARQVQIGQEVRLLLDAEPCVSKVSRLSPSLDRASRALMFEADIDNTSGRLRAGLFTEADVVLNAAETAIAIPESAIVEFAGAEKVWKVMAGKSVEQLVSTGQRREGMVEITQGLSSGDQILKEGRAGRAAEITITATEHIGTADAPTVETSASGP